VSDANKEWWPQAEAVIGSINAYQISGDRRFLDAAARTWAFIEKRFVDHAGGEWFHAVTKDGVPDRQPKISLWKCPYHNSRACYEVIDRLVRLGL
jgi:mannobiose 2-epimerase